MATIVQNREIPGCIRVAAVFDDGTVKPVWFEILENPAADRVFIDKVNMNWVYHLGSAKIISYAVSARDGHNYTLELNTEEMTWALSVVDTLPFP
jgi:hypothetical protein